jgi:hypothetical protein
MTTKEETKVTRKAYNRSYLEKYRKQPEIKDKARVYQKEYRQRGYVKEAHRLANMKWNKTKACKTSKKKYRDSDHGKARRNYWLDNLGGREIAKTSNKKYMGTEQAKRLHKNRLRRYREKLRITLLALIGNKCARCGFSNTRALEIDHIDNDGSIERKKFGHYRAEWNYYIKNPDEIPNSLQILCCNCNKIKYFETLESGLPSFS